MTHLTRCKGKVLDFGCGPYSHLGLVAARLGYQVTAIDPTDVQWPYTHPRLTFRQGDILENGLEPSTFDVIINCSSIEHVGIPGRYGQADLPNGDLEAMSVFRKILKPGGKMILTLPVGRDEVFKPFHRVYGVERLAQLFQSWSIREKEFWIKDKENRWVSVDEEIGINQKASLTYYGLGLFVLEPKG